jgi:mannose-6-phosphate isomerase
MGSHPSHPSKDFYTGRSLLELFEGEEGQALLSTQITARYGDRLPFLFKVLSINKALSIQAHPNKSLAEQLHARDPENYPDDNHKPEMAIAITPFEGLCGFRPLGEIAHFLDTISPLRTLVGEEVASAFVQAAKSDDVGIKKQALREAFTGLMSSLSTDVDREVPSLVELAKSKGSDFANGGVVSTSGAVLSDIVTRLHSQFGSDIGIFVLFFLNFVTLQPGEALFLVADDIHAYVSGDIIECMAASDNVVRAGLTPKFKDTDTLITMLTYNFAPIEEQKMAPTEYPYVTINSKGYSSSSSVLLYDPPIEEFSVVRTALKGGEGSKAAFEPLAGPSILICIGGRGRISVGPKMEEVREGYVFFVGATAECVLHAEGDDEDEFVTFKAFCELDDSKEKQKQ